MPDSGPSRKLQIAGCAGHGRIAGVRSSDRVSFACFFCNIFRKHRSESLPHVAFILRVQEASVILRPRRRGAPEVVYGGSQEFPRSCGRGEGAKKLSSVPGGHILGGYEGTCSAFSADADLKQTILNSCRGIWRRAVLTVPLTAKALRANKGFADKSSFPDTCGIVTGRAVACRLT